MTITFDWRDGQSDVCSIVSRDSNGVMAGSRLDNGRCEVRKRMKFYVRFLDGFGLECLGIFISREEDSLGRGEFWNDER